MTGDKGPSRGPETTGNLSSKSSFDSVSAKESRDNLFYYLLWRMLYNPELFADPEKFDKAVKEEIGELGPEDGDLAQSIQDYRGFMTNPGHPDHNLPAGLVAERYSQRLRIPETLRSKPDPYFAGMLDQAKNLSGGLPADEMKWGLKEKIAYTFDVAKKYGLDGTMLAMQIRQESGFQNTVGSGAGALGIAQFIRSTGARYGLHATADFYNPRKALEAMAHYMSDLTRKYGSQAAALAAYNGGEGAANYLRENLGSNLTPDRMISFLNKQRDDARERGVFKSTAWYAETNTYLQRILGATTAAATPVTMTAAHTNDKTGLARAFDRTHGAGGNHHKVSGPVLESQHADGHKPDPATTL